MSGRCPSVVSWETPCLPHPAHTCAARALAHLKMEPRQCAGCGLQEHTVLFSGPEHEPQVPGHGDGDVQVAPGHEALATEALGVGHDCGQRQGPQDSPQEPGLLSTFPAA